MQESNWTRRSATVIYELESPIFVFSKKKKKMESVSKTCAHPSIHTCPWSIMPSDTLQGSSKVSSRGLQPAFVWFLIYFTWLSLLLFVFARKIGFSFSYFNCFYLCGWWGLVVPHDQSISILFCCYYANVFLFTVRHLSCDLVCLSRMYVLLSGVKAL